MAAELDKNRFRLLYVYDSDLTPRNFYVETLHQLGYKARFYRGDAKRQLTKALNEIAQTSQIPVTQVPGKKVPQNLKMEGFTLPFCFRL